jgi:hypothetical protein
MGTTPKLGLPYPELTDQANVPGDMKELADAIDAAYVVPDDDDTGWINAAPYFVPTSSMTVTTSYVRRIGKMVYLWVKGTAKWTSNAPASGDITNTVLMNVSDPYRPSAPGGDVIEQFLGSSANGRVVHYTMYGATISAVSTIGGSAIASGDPISISGSYLL